MIVLDRTDILDICACASVMIAMHINYSSWKNGTKNKKKEE